MRTVRWKFRGTPRTQLQPGNKPFEADVTLDDEQYAWYVATGKEVFALEPGDERRSKLLDEIHFFMEAALLLDARSAPEGLPAPQGGSNGEVPEAPAQLTMFPPPEPPKGVGGFNIPESARQKMRDASFHERDNATAGGAPPPPLPPPPEGPDEPDEPDDEDEPEDGDDELTGKFYGSDPTDTERESGAEVERRDKGRLKTGSLGHRFLAVFEPGKRLTAYDASLRLGKAGHTKRREARRLYMRGFLRKNGTLPNLAVEDGRKHVDAYEITDAGMAEQVRLGPPPPPKQ